LGGLRGSGEQICGRGTLRSCHFRRGISDHWEEINLDMGKKKATTKNDQGKYSPNLKKRFCKKNPISE